MKVKFIGNPSDPDDQNKHCNMFGMDFFYGVETDVSDLGEFEKKKLAGNKHFLVVGSDDAAQEPKRGPGRPRKLDFDETER